MDRYTALLSDAREGDRDALDTFVRITHDDVWAVCRHLGDADSVEDLVQSTYLRALNALPGYRGDGNGRGWLLAIARHTCIDATRRRIRQRAHRSNREPGEVAVADPDSTVVDDLVGRLDPDRREAFVLTQLAGCSYAEAAEVLDCPIGTVRSRVARAREDLIRELGNQSAPVDDQ